MSTITTEKEVHVGDIGTIFEIELRDDGVLVDLSNVTGASVVFYKPDRTSLVKTGNVDVPNSLVKYATISGDLDQKGHWKLQVVVTMAAGTWHSEVVSFYVHANLPTV